MSKPDISALSIDELNALMIDAKELAIKRRGEELKRLVDGLLVESKAFHVTNAAVIAEIRKRESGTKTKKPRASSSSKVEPNPWVAGVVYCNPEDQTKKWKGGNPGPKPPWLTAIISKSMSHADRVAKYAELVKK